MRGILLIAGIMLGLLVVPAAALADPPPTLSVNYNQLPDNGGYTVTATLSSPSPYDCTEGGQNDPPQYPDLTWSQSDQQDPPVDNYTAPLSEDNMAGDQEAPACNSQTWTTDPSEPFGMSNADNASEFSPGTWYFQVALYCPTDGSDPDCNDGVTYTNIVSLNIPQAGGSDDASGSGATSGSSGSSGAGTTSSSGGSAGPAGTAGPGGSGGSAGSGATVRSGGSGSTVSSIRAAYDKALAACSKKKGAQKTKCRRSAKLTRDRRLALLKCQPKDGATKTACIRKADALKS